MVRSGSSLSLFPFKTTLWQIGLRITDLSAWSSVVQTHFGSSLSLFPSKTALIADVSENYMYLFSIRFL